MATKSKIPEKKPMGEMTDTQKIAYLEQENAELRDVVDSFERDSQYALFFAVNRKNNEMAKMLNRSSLSLEDKSIQAYQSMMKGMEDTFATLTKLRNEYLKSNATDLEELEKKGTPLIELRAEENKKAQ